jgi:hypothetical protein
MGNYQCWDAFLKELKNEVAGVVAFRADFTP